MFARYLKILLLLMLVSSPQLLCAADKTPDRDALSGLKSAKVIFDVRVDDLDKLIFNLKLVSETFKGMVAQGIKPEMVVAFRGPGVKFLSEEYLEEEDSDDEVVDLLDDLDRKAVRLEVCAIALRSFKVDRAELVSGVKVVANVFNSLIGYQNKGYALIVIN